MQSFLRGAARSVQMDYPKVVAPSSMAGTKKAASAKAEAAIPSMTGREN